MLPPRPVPLFRPATLKQCRICPRDCGVDRSRGATGFCRTDTGFSIAAITRHRGEEPVLAGEGGICNVFFGHCNLRCRFCQNHQISRNERIIRGADWSLEQVVTAICDLLDEGRQRLGFVSPTHMVPQMVAIIRAIRQRGLRPIVVYNTNGYDRVETLKGLEEWVDVYLPDCKYSDQKLAGWLSGASDYPRVAASALLEMYRQKGNLLHLDETGLAERGLIVRHLVLPGAVANSLGVLHFLAEQLSPRLSLSLMAQYQPTPAMAGCPPLDRPLHPEEYAQVAAAMERLGFTNGWTQECASASQYNPDFDRDDPFLEEERGQNT